MSTTAPVRRSHSTPAPVKVSRLAAARAQAARPAKAPSSSAHGKRYPLAIADTQATNFAGAQLSNTTISDSAGYGVNELYTGALVDFVTTNTFTNVALCKQTTPEESAGTCPTTVTCPP